MKHYRNSVVCVLISLPVLAVGASTMRFADPAKVVVSDAFWSPKFETWRTKTVPDVLEKLETRSHALENFDKAAGKAEGGHCGACFFDGLYYETLRGVSDYLARWPSPELEARLDRAIDRIVAAQLPDGYLHTWVQLGRPEKRWGDGGGCLLEQHEIYDAGALVEAGVHHYRATGKVKLLAAGIRFANLLCDTIGPRPKRNIIPTHSIAEEALVKLARLLKDEPALAAKAGVEGRPDAYLALVKFWFDNHGVHCGEPEWEVHGSHSGGAPYAMEIVKRMTGTAHGPEWRPCWGDYQMDRVPLDRYTSIEGHAVRATLLCTGLASYAYETGDGKCAALASRFWESMVGRKMYVTGGVGARSDFERFGDDWELPPDAYLETCAAIGSAFFSGWMAVLTGEGRYMDEFERVIYNALLTAVAEDGCHYTYQNPLNTARGERWDWHGCPCCPPMFLKLTGALPGYVYASDAEGLRVNLFIGGEADCTVGGQRVILRQTTRYPDEGVVEISVAAERSVKFPLRIRIPGWARGVENPFGLYASDGVRDWSLTLNGAALKPALDRGYAVVDREWRTGDKVTLTLDVSPRTIRADARVKDVAGCHAVARGPVVMAEEKGKTISYWQVANGGPAPHQVWLKDE